MHRYTVDLRIVGHDLNTEEVTQTLGLSPTQVRKRGERRGEGSTWTSNTWVFEVLPPVGGDWVSLDDALVSLLSAIDPIRSRLEPYLRTNDVYLWCGHFTSSFGGGPTLSPSVLKSLANLGVRLCLDTYCEVPDETEQSPAE
jgi:hypothetical protein